MRRSLAALILLSVGITAGLGAHDMFLKLTSYFLRENSDVTIPLLNGTFSLSENAIARNRIADISIVSGPARRRLDTTTVTERGDTTFFAARTGRAGTYLFGVSTHPNVIRLSGREFTGYLEEEGLQDVVAARRAAGTTADSTAERYSKHVKAIFQVGEARTTDFATPLGYPAELVPLANPYTLRVGERLQVRALVRGSAAPNLTLLAGGRSPSGARLRVQTVRTDAQGLATIRLSSAGTYYVKFISMVKPAGGDVEYESNWATLTFQIR